MGTKEESMKHDIVEKGIKDDFEFTGERFVPDAVSGVISVEHYTRYNAVADILNGKDVLDIASGEGYGTYCIAEKARTAVGMDVDEKSIEHAQRKYQRPNLKYRIGDATKIDVEDDSFDVVVSFETIEHIDEKSQQMFLGEIKRILRPNGILIMSTPDKRVYTDIPQNVNTYHVKEFYEKEFRVFLGQAFKNVYFFRQGTIDLGELKLGVIVNPEKPSLFLNHEIKEEQLLYIIGVCSNSELRDEIQNLSRIYVDSSDAIPIDLFFDRGNGFSHNDKKMLSVNPSDGIVHIFTNWNGAGKEEIKRLRLDLLKTCSLRPLQLKSNIKAIELEYSGAKQINGEYNFYLGNVKILIKGLIPEKGYIDITFAYRDLSAEELDEEIKNVNRGLEQLKEKTKKLLTCEKELNEIKSSHGWRLLQYVYKFRDGIIPLNSRRRLFLKLIYKTISHPRLMLEHLSVENISKLVRYMKNDNIEDLNARLALHLPADIEYSHQLSLIPMHESNAKVIEEYENIVFPVWDDIDVSIIIPVYDQFNYTYNCLQSIINNTKDVSYEVIIADDVSDDFTKDISKITENIRIVRNESNLGFLKNCNNASKSARGKYILFLNNDTQVQPNWLRPLVDILEKNPDIGMTGSKLVYPNGILQEAGGIFWRDGSAWNYGHGQNPNSPEFNYVKDVDYISGASLMIRRELWEKIGGFDEDFAPAYCEDSDLAFSVRQHGYRVVFQPKSVVVHFEGISNGKDLKKGIKKYQVENQKKFFEKWKSVLQAENFDNGTDVYWARDRSRNKKTIVVIDHYVPHYDQDAGGRTTWHYLNFLVQLGFHVIFVGDNYFPHEPYTSQLQQLGIEVLAGNGWNLKRFKKWVTENSKYIDYVLLNRPHISVKYIDLFKQRTNAKIIYYGHDLHFIREQRQYEVEHDKSLLSSAEKWKKLECELVDKADIIYTPGSYEEGVLHEMFPEKRVQAIPIYLYETQELDSMLIPNVSARSDLIFVGGFAHKPNEDAVKWLITEIYPLILNVHPDTKLYIVGSHPTEYIKSLASEQIIVTGYVSDEELERYYQNARVAVVPLRYGAGIKGKIVEAIAHGLPTVTTPIGAEGLLDVDECVEIAEVGDANDYAEKTLKLLSDDTLWEKESKAEQKYIREHFTTECAKKILLDDLKL